MNAKLLATGAALLTAFAAPAYAQTVQSVDIVGTAERFCTLPTSWTFVSGFNGGSSAQFSGTTWTIDPQLIATTEGKPVSGGEVAIRVRGSARCNTTHRITLQSANGGLEHGSSSAGSAPSGFLRTRRMQYQANWRDTTNGIIGWVPAAPGASIDYDYTVAPPGDRDFDVRMGLLRDPSASPMLAGAYRDTLTVSISINP